MDQITNKIIKLCEDELIPIIKDLVNISFQQGKVPSRLKIARVLPVFKKGAKDDVSNNRPISILPPISKIFEMAFRVRIINYLDTLDFLTNKQYGFRKNTNTNFAALDITTEEHLINQMKEDMAKLMDWMELNGLFINLEKTQFIIFKKPVAITPQIAEFTFRDHKILRTDSFKFLGLQLDENLLWDRHIQDICKKISPVVGVLYRLRNIFDHTSKRALYYGLIHSRLSYMAAIRGTANSSRLYPLKILQKRAIKTLFGYNYRTDSEQIFRETSILMILKAQATTCLAITKGFRTCNTSFKLNQDIHSKIKVSIGTFPDQPNMESKPSGDLESP
ncbi:RNA-directed DNA polymerase from mobile element jockey [Frankliniella fusca]|uniref:RNA-directed DNA polymerase from mobile element jockey n=1 Tax=Frankliniella fusca TaxID=407009 RepID=A0AAE1HD85_9NEOP|nr:RNA-directed DNA polymerase from mobile element jockey [Frankliniella fusca]